MIMSLLMRLIGWFHRHGPSQGDVAYRRAMAASDEVIRCMREASGSKDVARAVMADLWAQSHNVPYMTTVYEAAQEMKAPLAQRANDK